MASLQAQSTGEDSNSSDASDRGDLDDQMDGINGSLDHARSSGFPSAFLGLQGIPGLLPGPSGMHGADNFGKLMFYNNVFLKKHFYFEFYFIKQKNYYLKEKNENQGWVY